MQTESIKDVKLNPCLDSGQMEEMQKLLGKYENILTDIPGQSDLGEHRIQLENDAPILQDLILYH